MIEELLEAAIKRYEKTSKNCDSVYSPCEEFRSATEDLYQASKFALKLINQFHSDTLQGVESKWEKNSDSTGSLMN